MADRQRPPGTVSLTDHLLAWRKLRVVEPSERDQFRGRWRRIVEIMRDRCTVRTAPCWFPPSTTCCTRGRSSTSRGWFHPRRPESGTKVSRPRPAAAAQGVPASIGPCLGIWVLSDRLKRYLQAAGIPARSTGPTSPPTCRHARSRFRRSWRHGPGGSCSQAAAPARRSLRSRHRDSTGSLPAIPAGDCLDHPLVQDGVVFLSLPDSPANTTVVDCIARTTPVLVNRVDTVTEYLGDGYPALRHEAWARVLLTVM
jgi:hypothetical protein